jgi:gamma-glutamylcyclotransferase (GGCT)/AIG2-like uncharacterized protein YtfP
MIRGTVFRLPDNTDLLDQFDHYEGFDAGAPKSSLFVRKLHPVTLAGGRVLRCWVYVYNRNPGTAPLIADGRYRLPSSGKLRHRPVATTSLR